MHLHNLLGELFIWNTLEQVCRLSLLSVAFVVWFGFVLTFFCISKGLCLFLNKRFLDVFMPGFCSLSNASNLAASFFKFARELAYIWTGRLPCLINGSCVAQMVIWKRVSISFRGCSSHWLLQIVTFRRFSVCFDSYWVRFAQRQIILLLNCHAAKANKS